MIEAGVIGAGWITPAGLGRLQHNALPQLTEGPLPEVKRADIFDQPDKRFGRLDQFSKVGLGAITLAVRDANLEEWTEKRPVAVIATTGEGCLHTDVDYFNTVIPDAGKFASPQIFAYTLPNCFLGEAAIRFGFTGSSFVVNTTGPLLESVIEMALEEMAGDHLSHVVCGYNNPYIPGADIGPSGALFLVLSAMPADPALTVSLKTGQLQFGSALKLLFS